VAHLNQTITSLRVTAT